MHWYQYMYRYRHQCYVPVAKVGFNNHVHWFIIFQVNEGYSSPRPVLWSSSLFASLFFIFLWSPFSFVVFTPQNIAIEIQIEKSLKIEFSKKIIRILILSLSSSSSSRVQHPMRTNWSINDNHQHDLLSHNPTCTQHSSPLRLSYFSMAAAD